MTIRLLLVLTAAILPGLALAAGWTRYGNVRFGYAIEVPPGFSAIREAENGDGGTATAADGHAVLSAWGTNLLDETFASEVASRMSGDAGGGWAIGYRLATAKGASWSGTKGDRIVYTRAVPRCRDQAAFVRIEYDASARAAFDPVVARLARSLRASGGC